MVYSKETRLRLCDINKKRLPFIKEELRKKVLIPWSILTEKELNRIRKPFESYDKELLEEGYPESSEHLRRLLAVKSSKNLERRDTTLIDDKALLNHTMSCLKNLEVCLRDGRSTTDAISKLILLAEKITELCEGVACVLYEIVLEKIKITSCAELLKCEAQFSFGKFLVKMEDYERANNVLEEALKYSEENNFRELVMRICKIYYESLYKLCLHLKTVNEELAIQLADDSKNVALKMNDIKAITKSLIERGNILMSMQNYKEAIIDFESASSELKKLPDLDLKAEVLYKLSTCYFTTENYDACLLSLGALGRLAAIYKKVIYQAHFGRIDGNVKLLIGENIIARKNFIKSIEIYDNIGLREYATNCRFLEAIAKCEHLINPWINLIIDGEKERSLEDKYEFNKSKILVFNWKLKREYFCEMID